MEFTIRTFSGLSSFPQPPSFGFCHFVVCKNSTFLLISGCAIVRLYHNSFIHLPFERHLSSYQFLAFTDKTAVNINVQVLIWTCAFFLLGKYLGVERLGCMVGIGLAC